MTDVYKRFVKGKQRKCFAIGCSFGGMLLTNVLGTEKDFFLDAACVINACMKMVETDENFRTACYGLYNRVLGKQLYALIIENEPAMRAHFKKNLNIDILKAVEANPPSVSNYDDLFTCPCFGFKDRRDYYQ